MISKVWLTPEKHTVHTQTHTQHLVTTGLSPLSTGTPERPWKCYTNIGTECRVQQNNLEQPFTYSSVLELNLPQSQFLHLKPSL